MGFQRWRKRWLYCRKRAWEVGIRGGQGLRYPFIIVAVGDCCYRDGITSSGALFIIIIDLSWIWKILAAPNGSLSLPFYCMEIESSGCYRCFPFWQIFEVPLLLGTKCSTGSTNMIRNPSKTLSKKSNQLSWKRHEEVPHKSEWLAISKNEGLGETVGFRSSPVWLASLCAE